MIDYRILGPLEVGADGRVIEIGGPMARCASSASPYRSPKRPSSAVDPSMSLNSIVTVPVRSSPTPRLSPRPGQPASARNTCSTVPGGRAGY
jgi:hypothetical protein